MNEEEEEKMTEVEKSLQDSFFDVGRSNNDFMHLQLLLSTHLRPHCIVLRAQGNQRKNTICYIDNKIIC